MSKKRKKEVVTEVIEEIPWQNMKTKEILKNLVQMRKVYGIATWSQNSKFMDQTKLQL